ncbi:hypothetical protein NDA16_000571 [Ustilago loliicola]|nr:hypothetical protein NDA16_000571 [Ustilago loliicola]
MSQVGDQLASVQAGRDVEHQDTGIISPSEPSIQPTEEDPDDDPFLVNFEHNDPKDPRVFPAWRKIQILVVTMLLEFWVNVISSIYSFGAHDVAVEFGIGAVASRVPAALFLFGFAVGPVFAAPLSEDFGRVPVMIVGLAILALLQVGCALANNLATLIVLRFIGGCFGAVAFNSIGTVADLWDADNQGWGVNTFALAAEGGATAGPIIGAFIVQDAGWRWTFGVSGIVLAFLLAVFVLTVPETRAGVILSRRAKKLRKTHGDPRYYATHDKARSQHTVKNLFKETVGPSYSIYAASAIAAQSFMRELMCGSFTIITEIMYHNVGYQWSSSILAFIGVPLSIIPLIFYKFGPTIRRRSSFAKELQLVEEREKRRRAKLESRATTLTSTGNEPVKSN